MGRELPHPKNRIGSGHRHRGGIGSGTAARLHLNCMARFVWPADPKCIKWPPSRKIHLLRPENSGEAAVPALQYSCGRSRKSPASKFSVCRDCINKLKRGENVNTDTLVSICKALGCTFDDIMELIPDKPTQSEEKQIQP